MLEDNKIDLNQKTMPQIIGGFIIKALIFALLGQFCLWGYIALDAAREIDTKIAWLTSEVTRENCLSKENGAYQEFLCDLIFTNASSIFIEYPVGSDLENMVESVEVVSASYLEAGGEDKHWKYVLSSEGESAIETPTVRSQIHEVFSVVSPSDDWGDVFGTDIYDFQKVTSWAADGTPNGFTDYSIHGGRLEPTAVHGSYVLKDLYSDSDNTAGCYSYMNAPQKYTPIRIDLNMDIYLPMFMYFGKIDHVTSPYTTDEEADAAWTSGDTLGGMEPVWLPGTDTPALKVRLHRTAVVIGNKYFKGLPIGTMSDM